MFCSHCGAQVKDTAAFCYKCGAKLGVRIATGSSAEPETDKAPNTKANEEPAPTQRQASSVPSEGDTGNGAKIATDKETDIQSAVEQGSQKETGTQKSATSAPQKETKSTTQKKPTVSQTTVRVSSKIEDTSYLPIEGATIIFAVLVLLCYFMPIVSAGSYGSYTMFDISTSSNIKLVAQLLDEDLSGVAPLFFFVPLCCVIASACANKHPMLNIASCCEGVLFFFIFSGYLSEIANSWASKWIESYIGYGFTMYWVCSFALAICAGVSVYQRMKRR